MKQNKGNLPESVSSSRTGPVWYRTNFRQNFVDTARSPRSSQSGGGQIMLHLYTFSIFTVFTRPQCPYSTLLNADRQARHYIFMSLRHIILNL